MPARPRRPLPEPIPVQGIAVAMVATSMVLVLTSAVELGWTVGNAGVLVANNHATPALLILSLLVFEALYVTLGVTGIVVLIRTAIAERRMRRAAAAAHLLPS